MTLVVAAEPTPLETNIDGVVLVGKTRVTLKLADVYATIGFYLNHHHDVEAYLQQRRTQAQEVRKMNEAKFDPQGLRDRLLARQVEKSA
jgi:hypothetical protein